MSGSTIKFMKNKQPTYTLWHNGDLVATGKHNRNTLDDFIAQGRELVESAPLLGEAEIFSSHDDGRVWNLSADKLKKSLELQERFAKMSEDEFWDLESNI